ncbi:unnamed protein product [Sympodiomycopsis kandeliae]
MVSAESSPHIRAHTDDSSQQQVDHRYSSNDTNTLGPPVAAAESNTSNDVQSMDFDLSEFAIPSSLDNINLFSGQEDTISKATPQPSSSGAMHPHLRQHHHNHHHHHGSVPHSAAASASASPVSGTPAPETSSRSQSATTTKSAAHSPAPHRSSKQQSFPQSISHHVASPASSSAQSSAQGHPLTSVYSVNGGMDTDNGGGRATEGQQHDQQSSATANALQQFLSALNQSQMQQDRSGSSDQQQQQQQQQPTQGASNSSTPNGSSAMAPSQSQQQQQQQLNLQDIQRLIAEKEQADRLQSLQTALLRQQLETLSRAQQNPRVIQQLPQQQQRDLLGSQNSVQQLLSLLQQQNVAQQIQPNNNAVAALGNPQSHDLSSQLSPDAQELLNSLLNSSGADQQQQQQHHQPQHQQHHQHQQQMQNPGQNGNNSFSKLLSDTSFLAQYGLITPPASGNFNIASAMSPPGASASGRSHSGSLSHQQAPFMSPLDMPQGSQSHNMTSGMVRNQFSPLESPAVTPASVFSNMSLGGMSQSTEQFFSPLTSPALHPQPPYYGMGGGLTNKSHKVKSTTPNASPLALTGKPGPLPRKNRSTTAEARANRSRPSPLIKPTGSTTKRKKDAQQASTSNNNSAGPSSSRRPSVSEPAHSRSGSQNRDYHSGTSSYSTFTPVMAGVTKPMDASPSEGAVSTPSPIDLSNAATLGGGDTGKPMTPSSLMGIQSASTSGDSSSLPKRQSRLRASSSAQDVQQGTAMSSASSTSTMNSSQINGKSKSKNPQVTFATGATAGDDEDDDAGNEDRGLNGDMSLGGGSDSRRTSHKAAEQKRRDSLKYCFDELRGMLPPITLDEDAPGGSSLGPDGLTEDEEAEGFDRRDVMDPEYSKTANRAISKVALLRHSNEWVIRLRHRLARRDAALGTARNEIEQLRAMLMAHGIMPPPSYSVPVHMQPHHPPQGHYQMMNSGGENNHHLNAQSNTHSHGVEAGSMDWN